MNLGQYILILKNADQTKKVKLGLGNPHSWRGVYEELAFEPVENTTVSEMLSCAESAIGETYTGWKGGEFKMSENTTINIEREGSYSDSGLALTMLFDLMLSN